MTSPDLHTDALERDLRAVLAWEPSSLTLQRIDRQVAQVAQRSVIRERGWRLPSRRVLALLVAGLLLIGAAAAVTLLQQAVNLDPRWRTAVERAERLNLRQTIGDYTVTLERGYADPNELVLVVDVQGPGNSFVALSQADVVDAQGRHYLEITAAGASESASGQGADVHAYQVPPGVSGPLELTVTVSPLNSEPISDLSSPPTWFSLPPDRWPAEEPGLVGPWVFHIVLPLHDGVRLAQDATVQAAGVSMTLRDVTVTQTAIRVVLDTDLSAHRSDEFPRWSVEGSIRHDGDAALPLDWIPISPAWSGQPIGLEVLSMLQAAEDGSVMVRQTRDGEESPSGEWTLTVERLIGSSRCVFGSPWLPCEDPGATTEITGPWTFTFTIP